MERVQYLFATHWFWKRVMGPGAQEVRPGWRAIVTRSCTLRAYPKCLNQLHAECVTPPCLLTTSPCTQVIDREHTRQAGRKAHAMEGTYAEPAAAAKGDNGKERVTAEPTA